MNRVPEPTKKTRRERRLDLVRVRREMNWAYWNLGDPIAVPPSERAERLRDLADRNILAFTRLTLIVAKLLRDENVDSLLRELELDLAGDEGAQEQHRLTVANTVKFAARLSNN